jgi:hypothetical protein
MPNPKKLKEKVQDKVTDIKYNRVERKISNAKARSPQAGAKAEKKFGYNYEGAISAGLSPDSTGHWPSRNPNTGEILKGKRHPTINKTKKAERELGYKITKKDGVLYSNPKPQKLSLNKTKKK